MDRSKFILAKNCEAVKPDLRVTCCDSLMFAVDNYQQVDCEKYGFRAGIENYANIFQKNMMDCILFKRDGKCCLSTYMK
jgi:hypothetical protein